jgi:hypothetical protein
MKKLDILVELSSSASLHVYIEGIHIDKALN